MRFLLIVCSCFLAFNSTFAQLVNFNITGNKCKNSEITFIDKTEGSISNWVWDFGDGSTKNGTAKTTHKFSNSGTYTVQLTITMSGIEYSTTKTIEIHEYPVCNFTVDTVYFSSFTRIFTDSSLSKHKLTEFEWRFEDNKTLKTENKTTQYKYNKEGDFKVWHKVTDNSGCSDSISKTVTIKDIYEVPNVFSPNGDGINDLFVVKVNGVEKFDIEIVSRWGNLVFKRQGVQQIVWDGTMPDGSKLQTGTYFYIIKASDSDKEYLPNRGHITIFCEQK